MQKRISALLLAMVIVIGSVLNGNTLKVKAASATVAMSPELAAEFYLFLYQLTETAMHVGGANKGLDSKEAMETLRDGVIGYYSVSGEKNVDFEIKTTDGRTFKSYSNSGYRGGLVEYTTADGHTYKLSGDKFCTLLLNGTITLDPDIYNDTDEEPRVNDDDEYVKNMKAMFDAKWEELREIGFKDDSGDPTPSPSPDPEKKPFKNIALVTVGASLVALAGAFVKDLFDGKVEGVDPDVYIPDGMFTGYPTESNAGKINIYASYFYNNSSTLSEEKYSYNATNEDCFYFLASYGTTASGSYILKPGIYYISSGRTVFPSYSYLQDDLGNAFTFNWISYPVPDSGYRFGNYTIVSNIPIFAHFGFDAYCKGDTSMLLHAPDIYDFPDLVKSVPTVMQPLTGYEFAPGRLRNVNQALADAATKVQPETGTDTAAATKTYTDTMTDTMTKVAPKTEVNPLPSTTPGTETGDGFEGDSYKRDLKLIFPFCIPFDFIHFIQALSADPVAPCFKIPIKLDSLGIDMVLELDLAWMDPIMEIFRLGELGCFVIMLMAATKKMIGW
jgi:hypothetical protein